MKLLYCSSCHSMVALVQQLRQCECGLVKGTYTDNVGAVTNGKGFSIAIGNGSFYGALAESREAEKDFREDKEWALWWNSRPKGAGLMLAWARPNDGPANPHSSVDRNL